MDLAAHLAPLDPDLPEGLLDEVRSAYASPGRRYHTLEHVAEVLDRLAGLRWTGPREVALAALFHDAVYQVTASDNERRSAELAQQAIERWLPDQGVDAERVRQLIEWTAVHGRLAPGEVDEEAACFLDADLAILGAEPEAFDAYERGVAEEYLAAFPAPAYAAGRKAFLTSLLARPRIFLSETFHRRLDRQARRNIARALQRLG